MSPEAVPPVRSYGNLVERLCFRLIALIRYLPVVTVSILRDSDHWTTDVETQRHSDSELLLLVMTIHAGMPVQPVPAWTMQKVVKSVDNNYWGGGNDLSG